MIKIFIITVFLSLNCFAVTSDDANKLTGEYWNKDYTFWKKKCVGGIEYQIKEAAKNGDSYVHATNISCYGMMMDEVAVELKLRGFKTKLDSYGLDGYHWEEVLTIGW